ncbi:hypothetical protein ACLMJK_000344 [Lecanora helva]
MSQEEGADEYFSSDSSFYGDDDLKEELEDRCRDFDPSEYWANHAFQPATIAFNARAKKAKTQTPTKELYNLYEGDPNGRQLSEPVPDFLARLPPLTTHVSDLGPWLYIGNPYTSYRHTNENRKGFIARGQELLATYDSIKSEIETSNAGKAQGTVTRKITPHRKKLEADLLHAAKEKGCITGKWMLFPTPKDVNSAWRLVATATANDELGHAAKVATNTDESPEKARLICVYTDNVEDKADVKRVLLKLVDLGLCSRDVGAKGERAIYYKMDAYTYLDIMGGNEWGLRASMYSSRDILAEGK